MSSKSLNETEVGGGGSEGGGEFNSLFKQSELKFPKCRLKSKIL